MMRFLGCTSPSKFVQYASLWGLVILLALLYHAVIWGLYKLIFGDSPSPGVLTVYLIVLVALSPVALVVSYVWFYPKIKTSKYAWILGLIVFSCQFLWVLAMFSPEALAMLFYMFLGPFVLLFLFFGIPAVVILLSLSHFKGEGSAFVLGGMLFAILHGILVFNVFSPNFFQWGCYLLKGDKSLC